MGYKIGDELVVLVDDTFGYRDIVMRPVKVQIIGREGDGSSTLYLCYVPSYLSHPNSSMMTDRTLKRYGADKKFLNDEGIVIRQGSDVVKHIPCQEGEKCDHCGDFIISGVRDMDNCFKCRACHENPWR